MITQNRSSIIAAIVHATPVSIVYAAENGIVSARRIFPRSIERCRVNGESIVRAFDPQRDAPRSFRLDRIEKVI